MQSFPPIFQIQKYAGNCRIAEDYLPPIMFVGSLMTIMIMIMFIAALYNL